MKKEEKLKTLLNVDYNKLLAYLAGGLVSFFTLFQLLLELKKGIMLPEFLLFLISLTLFCGVCLFTYAGYHNFREILSIENKLGLKDSKPSNIFSTIKENKKSVSLWLKVIVWWFIGISFFIFLFINL